MLEVEGCKPFEILNIGKYERQYWQKTIGSGKTNKDKEYIEFIRSFTDEVNIMTKTFFIVVPYSPAIIKSSSGMVDSLLGGKAPKKQVEDTKQAIDMASFEEKRSQLDQRVRVIAEGLGRVGIKTSELKTDQIVELFYKTFNPGDISQGFKLE